LKRVGLLLERNSGLWRVIDQDLRMRIDFFYQFRRSHISQFTDLRRVSILGIRPRRRYFPGRDQAWLTSSSDEARRASMDDEFSFQLSPGASAWIICRPEPEAAPSPCAEGCPEPEAVPRPEHSAFRAKDGIAMKIGMILGKMVRIISIVVRSAKFQSQARYN
jgi:hypothetical protein